MTHRERVLRSIRFEPVDRIPYHISFTSEMRRKMDQHTGLADYSATLDNHLAAAFLDKPQEEIRPGFFRDEFGVVWNRTGVDKDIGVVDEYLIKDPDDLDALVLPPVDEKFIREKMDELMREKGDLFSYAAIGFSLFERAWTLRGMENLLADMIEEPDFVHALLEKITRRNLEIIDIALEYDIDCFHFGDDWGQQKGLIMGPKYWHMFIEPYLKQMYDRVRASGRIISQHSCGDLRDVIDTLCDLGLNIYQTFQPEIYGLDYAKKLHGRLAIWGGVSTQADLPTKTPDEIRRVTIDLIEAFGRTGLIAAPTHSVPGDVPPENILAMVSALHDFTF